MILSPFFQSRPHWKIICIALSPLVSYFQSLPQDFSYLSIANIRPRPFRIIQNDKRTFYWTIYKIRFDKFFFRYYTKQYHCTCEFWLNDKKDRYIVKHNLHSNDIINLKGIWKGLPRAVKTKWLPNVCTQEV